MSLTLLLWFLTNKICLSITFRSLFNVIVNYDQDLSMKLTKYLLNLNNQENNGLITAKNKTIYI